MREKIFGTEVNCNLKKSDIREQLSKWYPKETISDSLVMYDPASNTVTVDISASDEYAKYAAIHECICCGPYKDLAPKTDNPKKQCGLIDVMLLKEMPAENRSKYRAKRIEMFKDLLEKHLNPSLEEQFKQSIEILEEVNI